MRDEHDFPFGNGSMFGSESQIVCGWCGTIHNEGIGIEDDDKREGETVNSIRFGSLEVAHCCFGELEQAVLDWSSPIANWLSNKAKEALVLSNSLKNSSEKIERACEVLDTKKGT